MKRKNLKTLFANAKFLLSAFDVDGFPKANINEVAFMGRSNVGKSSLINSILNNKKICHTSNMPGRTQSLNFINVANEINFVDLPGYGFASAPKVKIKAWNKLIDDYLKIRVNLKRVFLLIDSRRSVKQNDVDMMSKLDKYGINYQIILTKIDKISLTKLRQLREEISNLPEKHPAMYEEIICTSSSKWQGIEEIREQISQFI